MPVETQIVSVSLAKGINTKTDPKQIQAEYTYVQNSIYTILEEINPRSGFTAISNATYSGGTITAGYGLAALNQSLLLHDGTKSWSYSTDIGKWVQAGQKQSVTVTEQVIGSNSSPFLCSVGMARSNNGTELYVWIDRAAVNGFTGIAYYSVLDTTNNITITSGTINNALANYSSIRADVIGSNFFITISDSAAITIYKQPSSTPNFSSASPTTVVASGAAEIIDTVASSAAIYVLSDKIYRVDGTTLAVTSTAASTYGQSPNAGINYDVTQNNVWVIYNNGTVAEAAILSATLVVVIALSTLGAVGAPSGGAVCLYVDNNQAYAFVPQAFLYQEIFSIFRSGGTFIVSDSIILSNSQVVSKPLIRADGYLYYVGIFISNNQLAADPVLASAFNPDQPITFLLKVDPTLIGATKLIPTVVSKALTYSTGLPYSLLTSTSHSNFLFFSPNPLIAISPTLIEFPNLQTTEDVASGLNGIVPSVPQDIPSSIVVKDIFQFNTSFRKGLLASNIYTNGGFVSSYDENIEVENNFHIYPEIIGTSQSGSTGVATGVYEYSVIYRWNDAQGQIQRSNPSVPFEVTVAGGPKIVNLTISLISLTDKPNYFVDVYRTTNAGTILYFLKSVPITIATILSSTLLLSFNDSNTQDQVSNIELYTTGGEVSNLAPPPTSFFVDFKNRLFAISSENPYSIWYTKQAITNFPAEWAQEFQIILEQRGGPAIALAPLDDKLIIFKQNAIFFMVGDGPSPSGQNNDFSYPQIVPSDSGCLEPASVVGFPDGICFKGSKGIYLMDRSLQVQYIGAPVEAYNQFTITSAVLDYSEYIIRYTLSNGVQLVYDYVVKKWSVFTNISAVDAVVGNGAYYYLQSNGVVQAETLGTYNDNGSAISLAFTSGWLSFAQIQGFERVKKLLLLGRNISANILTIGIAYDFNPIIVQTVTITNSLPLDPWQWRVFLDRQKCESLQLTFTVTPTGPNPVYGEGLSLSDIALEVGVKTGLYKLPASQSTS